VLALVGKCRGLKNFQLHPSILGDKPTNV